MKNNLSRISLPFLAFACLAGSVRPADLEQPVPATRRVAPGKFQATWESLAQNYQCPDWFRDAKFGIWAH